MNIQKDNFDKLVQAVIQAGDIAAEKQKSISRSYKGDGSVLTETDTYLDTFLTEQITKLFPGSRIVSEENPALDSTSAEWTFAIDPIDGTDSYSQGMPGWCVSVGILDKNMEPCGGVIHAPLWGPTGGSTLALIPGGKLLVNGKQFDPPGSDQNTAAIEEGRFQIMAGSKIHRFFSYRNFKGKVRVTGSAVLNITGILLHSEIAGTILTPCYIWDIAAAHSVIKNAGFNLEYIGGKEIDYNYLVGRKKAEDTLVAGSKKTIRELKKYFLPIMEKV